MIEAESQLGRRAAGEIAGLEPMLAGTLRFRLKAVSRVRPALAVDYRSLTCLYISQSDTANTDPITAATVCTNMISSDFRCGLWAASRTRITQAPAFR